MNDIEMNNEPFEERVENPQTKTNKISQIENEKIEKILTQLHEQIFLWQPHNWN